MSLSWNKIFVFALLLSITKFVAAEWIWEKKASLPFGNKRDRAVAFSINGFGYVGTGLDSANQVRNDIWKYDTINNSWSQMANFPGPARRDAVAFVIDSFAYVGTGIDDSSAWGTIMSDFYRYNPILNSWTQIDSMGSGLSYGVFKAAAFSVGGKGYVSTGRVWGAPTYETWMYDPSINLWTQKMSFPNFGGRNGAVAFTIANKAYLTTGSDDNYFYNDLWEYDALSDSWSQKQNFPGTPRIAAVAFTIDTLGFVGTGTDGGYKDDFWFYNSAINQWSYANQFPGDARRAAAAFSIGENGYLTCGKSETGTKRDLWKLTYFEPPTDILQITHSMNFYVFPNLISANSTFELKGIPDGDNEILIFNSIGILIEKIASLNKNIVVSSENYSRGEYFIQVKSSEKNYWSAVQKIFVL